jgi:hypothetical protein
MSQATQLLGLPSHNHTSRTGWPRPARADTGDFGSAFDSFAAGEWHQAFEHLKTLADAGSHDASRIALMLEAQGMRLFGMRFSVAPAQRVRWRHVAASAP